LLGFLVWLLSGDLSLSRDAQDKYERSQATDRDKEMQVRNISAYIARNPRLLEADGRRHRSDGEHGSDP
jgi:hypothetical protein